MRGLTPRSISKWQGWYE